MPSKHSAYGRGQTPTKCRECGARRADGVRISKRGLCTDCAIRRQREQCEQLNAGAGPMYDNWRDGMLSFADDLAATAD